MLVPEYVETDASLATGAVSVVVLAIFKAASYKFRGRNVCALLISCHRLGLLA